MIQLLLSFTPHERWLNYRIVSKLAPEKELKKLSLFWYPSWLTSNETIEEAIYIS